MGTRRRRRWRLPGSLQPSGRASKAARSSSSEGSPIEGRVLSFATAWASSSRFFQRSRSWWSADFVRPSRSASTLGPPLRSTSSRRAWKRSLRSSVARSSRAPSKRGATGSSTCTQRKIAAPRGRSITGLISPGCRVATAFASGSASRSSVTKPMAPPRSRVEDSDSACATAAKSAPAASRARTPSSVLRTSPLATSSAPGGYALKMSSRRQRPGSARAARRTSKSRCRSASVGSAWVSRWRFRARWASCASSRRRWLPVSSRTAAGRAAKRPARVSRITISSTLRRRPSREGAPLSSCTKRDQDSTSAADTSPPR